MLNLALALIHNKNANANRQQITTLLGLTTTTLVPQYNADGTPILDEEGAQITRPIYTITGVSIEHKVAFYQIVPFGVNEPSNLRTLDSHKVFYRAGDENKTGTHPRFNNWGIKRAWDHGNDIVGFITDIAQFSAAGLQFQLNRLVSRRLLVLPLWGVAVNVILFREIGQFREDLGFQASLDDLRARIITKGWDSD